MTTNTLSTSVVDQSFPAGTTDPGFTFTVTGTLADGTPFSASASNTSPTVSFDLAPGTYTGVVSKLGVSSQASAPLTIIAHVTVTLSVPDAAAAAILV